VALLAWSHDCIVGVKAMDDQHGILMDTMNELRHMLMRGSPRKAIDEQFDLLIEFTRSHFHSEEQLLEQHGFPGLAEHRAAHQHLLEQIRAFIDHAEHADGIKVQPLLQFLRIWYLEHTEGLDQKYGSWLNEHGVF